MYIKEIKTQKYENILFGTQFKVIIKYNLHTTKKIILKSINARDA